MTASIGGVRASAMAFANGKQVQVSNNSVSFSTVAGDNTLLVVPTSTKKTTQVMQFLKHTLIEGAA